MQEKDLEKDLNQTDSQETDNTATDDTAKEQEDTTCEATEETVEDEAANEIEDGEETPTKEKKSFFNKNKKDKKDEKIEELNDRLMRNLAEFDNFRKRSEREKTQMFDLGAKDIIEKILPVVDNFERGFDSISEEEKQTAFAQGMDKVYKQLISALDGAGVKAIESVGKEFDPNFHNAVMHVEDDSVEANIVVEEFQKGYTYRDNVVRHSMVKVAN